MSLSAYDSKNSILVLEIFDRILLIPVDPAGDRREEELQQIDVRDSWVLAHYDGAGR